MTIEHHDQYAAAEAEGPQIEADGDATLYASASRAAFPTIRPVDALLAENARLRSAIRVTALQYAPHLTHGEIDKFIKEIGTQAMPLSVPEPSLPPKHLTLQDDLDGAAALLRLHGHVVAQTIDKGPDADILAQIALTWPIRDVETYHARHPAVVAHRAADVIRNLRGEAAGWRGAQEATAKLLAAEFEAGAEAMREAAVEACRKELIPERQNKSTEENIYDGTVIMCAENIQRLSLPERKP